MNEVLRERGRAKSGMVAPVGSLLLMVLLTIATFLFGTDLAWVAPATAALIAGALAAERAAKIAGLNNAITTFEKRLRQQGVTVDYEELR